MLIKLLSFILIFSFIKTSALDAEGVACSPEKHESFEVSNTPIQNYFKSAHCEDCDDCSDKDHCCEEMATCGHFVLIDQESDILLPNLPLYSNTLWHFYLKYRSPLLDPALRPPSHS